MRAMLGRASPSEALFSVPTVRQDLSRDNIFPFVTALADTACAAGPKPCSGALFLIRKRIEKEFSIFVVVYQRLGSHSSGHLARAKQFCNPWTFDKTSSETGWWRIRGANGRTKIVYAQRDTWARG